MIEVLIPTNQKFKNYELKVKKLYEENQRMICDTNSFDFIKNNTLFYLFLKNNNVLGVIYFFVDNNKLFLNAFAKPKQHLDNLYCLKLATTWFCCPIYAEAQNRASALCLLKCGFKRVEKNLFILQINSQQDFL